MKFILDFIRLICLLGIIYLFTTVDESGAQIIDQKQINQSIETIDSASNELIGLLSTTAKLINL